jgi:carbamoyl-phosphate synthase small subunit
MPTRRSRRPFHVVAYDFGVKRNILRMLADRGCRVTVVPAQTPAAEVLALSPTAYSSPTARRPGALRLRDRRRSASCSTRHPLFGICLGTSCWPWPAARDLKMKFGHHGANHPVQDLRSGRVMITSQNHGFAVDDAQLPDCLEVTHRSLFDGSLQGIERTRPARVQLPGAPGGEPGSARGGASFSITSST